MRGQAMSRGGKIWHTGEMAKHSDKKNPAAVALGRLGAKKGGLARAKKLSVKRRKEIAQKAGRAGGRGRPKETS